MGAGDLWDYFVFFLMCGASCANGVFVPYCFGLGWGIVFERGGAVGELGLYLFFDVVYFYVNVIERAAVTPCSLLAIVVVLPIVLSLICLQRIELIKAPPKLRLCFALQRQ